MKEKFNIWLSLAGAMVLGRVAVLLAVFLFSNMNAVNFVLPNAREGWQGIALQLIFAPVIVKKLYNYFQNSKL